MNSYFTVLWINYSSLYTCQDKNLCSVWADLCLHVKRTLPSNRSAQNTMLAWSCCCRNTYSRLTEIFPRLYWDIFMDSKTMPVICWTGTQHSSQAFRRGTGFVMHKSSVWLKQHNHKPQKRISSRKKKSSQNTIILTPLRANQLCSSLETPREIKTKVCRAPCRRPAEGATFVPVPQRGA